MYFLREKTDPLHLFCQGMTWKAIQTILETIKFRTTQDIEEWFKSGIKIVSLDATLRCLYLLLSFIWSWKMCFSVIKTFSCYMPLLLIPSERQQVTCNNLSLDTKKLWNEWLESYSRWAFQKSDASDDPVICRLFNFCYRDNIEYGTRLSAINTISTFLPARDNFLYLSQNPTPPRSPTLKHSVFSMPKTCRSAPPFSPDLRRKTLHCWPVKPSKMLPSLTISKHFWNWRHHRPTELSITPSN